MSYKAPLIRSCILLAAFYLIITESYFHALLLIIFSFIFQSRGSQGKKAAHYRPIDAASYSFSYCSASTCTLWNLPYRPDSE